VKTGKKAEDAENAIEAAIGKKEDANVAAFGDDGGKIGKKNDQIAAAIVLRGIAKDGKFDLQNAAEQKKQLKSVVEAAVGAVTGEQILKAIVDAAGKDVKAGKKAADAANAIEAAIGAKEEGNAAAFGDGGGKIGKKNDQIAAAIVLRGIAKDGKFDLKENAGADKKAQLKSVVEAAVGKNVEAGKKASDAENAIEAAIGEKEDNAAAFGEDKIGKKNDQIAAAIVLRGIAKDGKFDLQNAAGADKKAQLRSVVEAAVGAGVKLEPAEVADAGNANNNKDAGKLFGSTGGNNDNDGVDKAAAAVGAVTGEQILKAIVDAAGKDVEAGKKAADAANAIEAAIGTNEADAAAAFGDDEIGKKNDQIAAAIVLRGIAKDGKFDLQNADKKKQLKSVVEAAVEAGVKFEPAKVADAGDANNNADAGKLFGSTDGNAAGDGVDKAAAAVGAVTGEQILKAIVDAAGKDVATGKKAADAENAIEAAIGANEDNVAAAFGDGEDKIGKKNDQIAAAIVLRGIAKGGKFDLQNAGADEQKKQLKSVVEAALRLV
ncbi:variable large family protein, partial [Borreliella americana]|uniref:variable large family protein n=1 Tax=Borreliella americana TaxID=478807 RepID=UPI001E4620F3